LTVVKNKVKHPKGCFTIECHLCHIDDQSILAAIVPQSILHPVELFFNSLIFTLNHRRPKMSQFDTSVKKIIEGIFLNATISHRFREPGLIAKLVDNWSLAAVARKLHCSKTCIFKIRRHERQ
jgi:hypothetical protein